MIVAELLTRLGFQLDETGLKKGKTMLQEFQGWAAKLAIGTAVAMIAKTAIEGAAEMESMEAQFTTMTGSAAEAQKIMKQARDYAAKSSFETGDVTKSISTLMQFGMTQKDAMEHTKRLGDVAGANKERFKSLSLAMAQVNSATKLQGGDLLQLVNAGWNPLRAIHERTGKSMAQLRKDMEKGLISAEMVNQALKDVTSEGGMFYKNQERQSKTLIGVYSTMVDNIKLKLTEMALAFSPVLKQLMSLVGDLDLSALVGGFKWLSAAIQYVAEVAWNSGLMEAVFIFKEQLGEFFASLSDTTGPAKFTTVLTNIGQFIGWVATLVLMAATTVMQFTQWLIAAAVWLWEWKGLLSTVALALLFVFGPSMIAKITAFTNATKIAGWAQLFFQRAALASGAAMGYQVTMMGLLKAAAYGVRSGFMAALNAARLFALSNPLTALLMAAAFTAYQLYRLYGAISDLKKEEKSNEELEAASQALKGLPEDAKAWREARDRGDTETMNLMAERMKRKRAQYHQLMGDHNKKQEEEGGGMPSFDAIIKAGDNKATVEMQKMVAGDQKIQNISNKTDVTINAPQGAEGKTGLGAGELGKLAEQVFRSQFSIQLQRVLVAGA